MLTSLFQPTSIAVIGASQTEGKLGNTTLKNIINSGYKGKIYPVNPNYDEVNGEKCLHSVKDLPADVENMILAVPPELSEEIAEQAVGSGIKRIWMVKGVGKGAFSEKAQTTCNENQIEVVHGFCPMMFYGSGGHKFHLWLRKTFGKLPGEYLVSPN